MGGFLYILLYTDLLPGKAVPQGGVLGVRHSTNTEWLEVYSVLTSCLVRLCLRGSGESEVQHKHRVLDVTTSF